ncbi:MAG TPA: sigma-70 family RNA polymerase sigma factor [Gemmataceae bacterium]|jgi:RNA polymerase sigma-70 factor (ECF subfamily)|nr:sigma-70 family RNA polymerase sigma factor [Gemmataceae bacterium]
MPMREAQPDSAETQALLRQVRAGDRQAFEQLFARHQAYLHRLIDLRLDPRLRSRVDASDVVQEAHLEALRRLDAYLDRPALPWRLWLRQIAFDRALKARRHHLVTARRALGREVPLPDRSSLVLARQLCAGGSTPSQQLNHMELARRLRQAVAQLPEADREIVLMRDFEELSNHEVACLLGMDPATTSRRHGRAMLRLHRILSDGWMTESQL